MAELRDNPNAFLETAPVRLRWEDKGLDRVDAAFQTESIAVRVTFELGDHGWHCGFKVKSDNPKDTVVYAFQVFGGVFQAVQDFLMIREPAAVIFSTTKPQLAVIYRSYLSRHRDWIEGRGYRLDLEAMTLAKPELQ